MLLLELFKSQPEHRQVVSDTAHRYEVRAIVGKREIVFLATLYEVHDNEWWDVEFAQVEEGEDDYDGGAPSQLTYELTKGGKEFEVFSFILQCLKELVQKRHPNKIKFSASKKDSETRAKLYEKLAKKFAAVHGYTMEREDKGAQVRFTMVKK